MEGNEAARPSVADMVAARLEGSGPPGRAAELVLAALLGDDVLATVLSGTGQPAAVKAPATAASPTGLYLNSVVVEGFRGIGPQAALRLQPGPGLTVVAGRNGSGKSSFAEAAELALTGDNMRWSGRAAVWRDGWRNLNTSGESRISVELTADGQPGVIRVNRDWPAGAGLDDAESFAQARGQQRQPLTALNLSAPLELFRPFLSYAELGGLLSGKPSEMYDALQAILGLDQLLGAEKRLTDARRQLEEPGRLARKELTALREQLEQLDAHADERAAKAAAAVRRRPWDLSSIDALATGAQPGADPVLRRLAEVTAITLPSADRAAEVISDLEAANVAVSDLQGTPAAEARHLARLLDVALTHQADHPGEPCPVCGGRPLDGQWAQQTRAEISRLDEEARAAESAHTQLTSALRAVRNLIGAEPPVLTQDLGGEIDCQAAASTAWQSWLDLVAEGTVEELVAAAAARFRAVAAALDQLQTEAAAASKRRDEAWQPMAAALASWAGQARRAERAEADLADVNTAIAWLRPTMQEIRDERMAPLTQKSAEVWELLRQESNVELGPVRLVGAATQRRVSLDVTVDGVEGAALSVMSQGELHALALALFLPRATSADSPFRFMVIDDPVQSMDPAKVDGLARLLAKVGEERQVVVFTHDDRLPEAIRRLQLPATIWDVSRREGSVVELTKSEDPVSRYLDDARSMALTSELPEDARAVVVAGFCRSALEAACHQIVRARRIKSGVRQAHIDRELGHAQTTHEMLTLAMLDDLGKGNQLGGRLRDRYGQAAVDAFHAVKSGTHTVYKGDLKHLVHEIDRLSSKLRA
jgi:DNA repair exonuclease SbcCD ATPase subunit